MKPSQLIVSFLAAFAVAAPIEVAIDAPLDAPVLEARQSTSVGTTANEFSRGGCRDIIFFFARGSTEIGNMVRDPPHNQTNKLVTYFCLLGKHCWTSHWKWSEAGLWCCSSCC